jgi:ABC-type uncharacterized transport system substrate-binding protein
MIPFLPIWLKSSRSVTLSQRFTLSAKPPRWAVLGTDFPHAWRQAGIYTGRVLKGEKPAELPVQQVTKLELIINLRIAKTLDLDVPLGLSAGANEVID